MVNKELKKAIADSAETDLSLLIGAKEDAKRRVMEDPSKANLDAFDKASKMLANALEGDAEPSFPNRVEAHSWLQRQGFKIGKSKLYQDCKHGLLRLQDDGSIFEADLKKYVRKVGLNQLSKTPDVDPGELQTKKLKAEIDKLRTQNEILQHQRDEKLRKYVSRTDFEMEFAAKIAVLKSGLEHMIYSYAFGWSELILNGDKDSAAQRLIASMNQNLIKQFNDFADIKKFHVIFAEADR